MITPEQRERQKLHKLIYDFLLDFKCMYTVELDTDDGLPLVDLLSPVTTIKEGKAEIQHISEELGDEIYKALTAHTEPEGKERVEENDISVKHGCIVPSGHYCEFQVPLTAHAEPEDEPIYICPECQTDQRYCRHSSAKLQQEDK